MKTAIPFLIVAILIISCSEPELNDPLAGNWKYESIDLSGAKPVIKASFSIKPTGDTYIIENLQVTINGAESKNYTSVVSAPTIGDKIGKIKLSNGDNIIEINNADQLGMSFPSWFIDNVQAEINNSVYTYSGQVFKQN